VFGQATVPLPYTSRLTFGGRYTDDTRSINGATYNILGSIVSAGGVVANQSARASAPTYRVSLDHNFTPDTMAYLSFNRGFKSGNFNTSSPTAPVTMPEYLDAYEIGLKSEMFDHTLQVNASGFYYQFRDVQVQQQTIVGNVTTNAAAAEYKGLDLQLISRPIPPLTLTVQSEVLEGHYTSYKNALFNFPASSGLGYVSQVSDATGYRMPYADPFTLSGSARYVVGTANGDWAFMGSFGYHSGFHFDSQGVVQQPRYTVANASVTWTAPSGAWETSLWGNNLTNTMYYAQKQVSAVGLTYSPAAPLTFGVRLKYHLR
jgi:iron complex outermembrane receptor protein